MPAFSRRYLFTGRLRLTSALHVGGGRGALLATDSPIVRTPTDEPFIPGSSFKGAFRSTVEKLAGSVASVRTCIFTEGQGCAGPQGPDQRDFNDRRRQQGWPEEQLLHELEGALCDTCKLFGSSFAASKALFSDLYLVPGEAPITQVRDGVGIDRDREGAVDGIKYDFEVVETDTAFQLRLLLDEPSDLEVGLVCMGLCEYIVGFGGIGGKRSRGLGNCRLDDLQVYELDLRDPASRVKRLSDYLLGRAGVGVMTAAPEQRMALLPSADAFLTAQIQALLERSAGNAATTRQ